MLGSSAETIGAFNMGFDTVNMYRTILHAATLSPPHASCFSSFSVTIVLPVEAIVVIRRASRANRFRANLRSLPRFEKKSDIGHVPERSALSWSNYQTGVGVFWQKTL